MLSNEKRKEYFRYLKLGEYNSTNIKNLQKKYFPHYTGEGKERKDNWDGVYGKDTDKLLVNLYNVTVDAPHFKLEEFKCHCGGRYCTGYHEYLNVNLLKNLEAVRKRFGVTNITSGLRCSTWNSKQTGSVTASKHTKGKACDIDGAITNTAAKRGRIKTYWYTLKNANYSYYGTANMGTAVHVDVK